MCRRRKGSRLGEGGMKRGERSALSKLRCVGGKLRPCVWRIDRSGDSIRNMQVRARVLRDLQWWLHLTAVRHGGKSMPRIVRRMTTGRVGVSPPPPPAHVRVGGLLLRVGQDARPGDIVARRDHIERRQDTHPDTSHDADVSATGLSVWTNELHSGSPPLGRAAQVGWRRSPCLGMSKVPPTRRDRYGYRLPRGAPSENPARSESTFSFRAY